MKSNVILLFLITIALGACSPQKPAEIQEPAVPSAEVVNLSPDDFRAKSQAGIILDVRTPGEVAQGKIPGSVAMDYYAPDFITKVNELPKDREIYLYCAVGARSEDAANLLIQQGYTKVYHLQGGIQAWAQAGNPIE